MTADGAAGSQPGAHGKAPNLILRRIREQERHETREEFAESMARVAREIGEPALPDAKYVAKLEAGDIGYPRPIYRRILAELCGRPFGELGFRPPPGLSVPEYGHPGGADSSSSGGTIPTQSSNTALRNAILASGLELSQIARRVGVNPKSVQRWVTRGVVPHPRHRWKTCEILSRDESELWPAVTSRLPETNLRAIDSLTYINQNLSDDRSGEDVVDVLSRIQRLHRGIVHPDIICHLQDNLSHTVTQYETLDHSSIVSILLKQRTWVDTLLSDCSRPKQRAQLFEIAGGTSGVLGYVAVGRGDFPLARAYCLEAFQLGDYAENATLQAWARGMYSFCEYYAGRYDEALRLAKDGLSYSESGPQSVRLTINGVARALGKLGDAEGVHRAVDSAYDLMSRSDVPSGVPSSISFECYSAAQTASNAATAYVSLRMPEKVQHYVGLALPDINKSGSAWSRSLVMIDLALSLIRAKETDLDHAADLVINALSISADHPIISVQQRTSEFIREATGRWGDASQISTVRDAAFTAKVR